jgi:hypothetical protein
MGSVSDGKLTNRDAKIQNETNNLKTSYVFLGVSIDQWITNLARCGMNFRTLCTFQRLQNVTMTASVELLALTECQVVMSNCYGLRVTIVMPRSTN